MFRSSTLNNHDDNSNNNDGEELEILNSNRNELEDSDDENNQAQTILVNNNDNDNDDNDNDDDGEFDDHHGTGVNNDILNNIFNRCFTKQFLKSLSIVVGILGLFLTVILTAFAYSSVHNDGGSSSGGGGGKYINLNLPLWVLNSIDSNRLKSHVKYLSSDMLQGRATGTLGEDLAVSYIQSIFSQSYLLPFGDKIETETNSYDYIQKVPLYGYNNVNDSKLVIGLMEFNYLDDFIATTRVLNQNQINLTNVQMVFVGYGIDSNHFNWNDFKDVNVSGKVIIAFVGSPLDIFNVSSSYTMRWTYKFEEAERKGALGIFLIHTTAGAGYPWSVLQSSGIKEQVTLNTLDNKSIPIKLAGWITKDVAQQIATANGQSLEQWTQSAHSKSFTPIDLNKDLSLSLTMSYPNREIIGKNVISMIKGSTNPNEYVVVMAHHDHLGMVVSVNNDTKIFHGAEDNASGVAALLETASVLGLYNKILNDLPIVNQIAMSNPISSRSFNRSVIFVSVTGEENGLLGALHFLKYGPIKERNGTIISVINFDIVNVRDETNDTIAFGLGFSPLLDQYLSNVCETESMAVSPDPNPSIGFLYRTDIFNFLVADIPALTIGSGSKFKNQSYPEYFNNIFTTYFSNRYHQPSDQFNSTWSFKGTVQQVKISSRLSFYLSNNNVTKPILKNTLY